MLKQNNDQEQVSQQFLGLKKALFDGQLICKPDHKLSLYFSYGGIFMLRAQIQNSGSRKFYCISLSYRGKTC